MLRYITFSFDHDIKKVEVTRETAMCFYTRPISRRSLQNMECELARLKSMERKEDAINV